MSSINMANNRSWNYNDQYFHKNPVASYVLLILSGMAMLIAAFVSASLTCKPLCCRPVQQEFVHHHPNQFNNQAPYQPSQAHYHPSQVYYQPNQASCQPLQVNNLALYHPNQVQSQVNTTNIIPNSDQAASLNLHVQPATVDEPVASGLTPPPAYEDLGGVDMIGHYQKRTHFSTDFDLARKEE